MSGIVVFPTLRMAHRILAIDDSITIRQFIQRNLSAADGFEVILARDGGDGLAAAHRERPDLILLDFILPDMRGDDVCRFLSELPETAGLPIVLMSSSAAEIKRAESEFHSVVRSIAKPFTPELLAATVRYVLREQKSKTRSDAAPAETLLASSPKPKAAPAPSRKAAMLGDTAKFPLLRVLRAAAAEQLTGALRLWSADAPLEVWFRDGRVAVVTHRDASVYLRGNPIRFTPEQTAALDIAVRGQHDCGCPPFLSLANRGVMPLEQALNACHWQGLRCFAPLWTHPRLRFEFESTQTLPDFCAQMEPFAGTVDEWAMESLRMVGDDALSAMAWGDFTGVPAYTRSGYERIQEIPLLEEELQFAAQVNGAASLLEIAQSLRLPVETAQLILYRFLTLEIFDYWPENLLNGAAA